MSLGRRLDRLEHQRRQSALPESTSPDMRSVARAVSFLLQRGIHEPAGPARETALDIARLLKATEAKKT